MLWTFIATWILSKVILGLYVTMRCAGYLKMLIQGGAFVIFVVQMIFAVQKYISKPTMTSMGTKSLSDLDKKVLVAICKLSQFDYKRAPIIGYKYQNDFFSGQLIEGKDCT